MLPIINITCVLSLADYIVTGIIRIWHYKNLTRKLRVKAGLPLLYDEDDLPDPMYDPNYVHVLSERQERQLHKSKAKFFALLTILMKRDPDQKQFMKSQTWYRPHGTPTHRVSSLFSLKHKNILTISYRRHFLLSEISFILIQS